MIEKIINMLKKKNIAAYKISERITESSELFFVKQNLDMDRAKNVHHYKITVYTDYEENGVKYRGDSTANLYPAMTDEEIENVIEKAAVASRYVKNPYYPLPNKKFECREKNNSDFSGNTLDYWSNEIAKIMYSCDNYDKGGINSCEIFVNKNYTHIINSEGIDVNAVDYDCMVEFVINWKENGEETELYKCLDFSNLIPKELIRQINEMITISKERAIAVKTPAIDKASVILTKEAVKSLFEFYYSKCSAQAVYNQESTWKINDQVQGNQVKGDKISLSLDPFMDNSTDWACFDESGYPLEPVTLIEYGTLKRYMADIRYAHYLNIEPTGTIRNFRVSAGKTSIDNLKKDPYLEVAAFSDFTVDGVSGSFGGEIRLAWYYDGNRVIPVTGGSITGNINQLHNEMYLSKEIIQINNFEGPMAVKLLNVTVTGIK